jgi:hypothetical protein
LLNVIFHQPPLSVTVLTCNKPKVPLLPFCETFTILFGFKVENIKPKSALGENGTSSKAMAFILVEVKESTFTKPTPGSILVLLPPYLYCTAKPSLPEVPLVPEVPDVPLVPEVPLEPGVPEAAKAYHE